MCDFRARDKTSQKTSSTAAHRPNPSCRSVVPIRRAQFTSMSKCAWLPSHASASLPSKWWPSSTCVLSLASSSSTSSATDVLTECAIPSIWDGHRKHNKPVNVWRQNKFYRDYFTTTAHCVKSIKRALNSALLLVLKIVIARSILVSNWTEDSLSATQSDHTMFMECTKLLLT